jgi:hypothetical protein
MTPEQVKSTYRRMIDSVGATVMIRRYTGSGTARPCFEVEVKARVTGYDANELIGNIQQGDRKAIMLAQDLIDAQFALPVRSSDKLVVRGKELAIIDPDDSTRRIQGVLVAYELQVRG